jgi:DNA-binding transcriptional LysR family regulator
VPWTDVEGGGWPESQSSTKNVCPRPSGLVKIACPITMARSIFASLLKVFLERYPDLEA